MSLLIDRSHKKIDCTSLNKNGRRIGMSIGPVALSLLLLSGCRASKFNNNDNNEVTNISNTSMVDEIDYKNDEHNPDDVISLENSCNIVLYNGDKIDDNKFLYKDLDKIKSIGVIVKDDYDYSYLNYLNNIQQLTILNQSHQNCFDNVDGSKFKNNLDIIVTEFSGDYEESFNEERYPFIKDIPNINCLSVGSEYYSSDLSSGYINTLDNVNQIILFIDELSNIRDFNFSENVSYLQFVGKPYNLSIYMTNDDFKKIKESGVNFAMSNPEKVEEINNKLDDIYSGLGIGDGDSDKDRVDAILSYVLDNCCYDEEIDKVYMEGGDYTKLSKSFYENGSLYGALEKKSQICGNYAALTYALGRRAGLDMFYLVSKDHVWNSVKLGDYTYYVDSTWVDQESIKIVTEDDGKIKVDSNYVFNNDLDGYKPNFNWYLEDPMNLPGNKMQKESHDLEFVPDGLELSNIPKEERDSQLGIMINESNNINDNNYINNVSDMSNKIYTVIYNGKKYEVCGAVLFGLLSAFGVGVLSGKKKKDKTSEFNSDYNNSKQL